MMNSLHRVLAAVNGQPSDRPPVLLNASLYGARLAGHSLETHFTDPEAYAEGQMAVRQVLGPDLLLSPFLAPAYGEAFGSVVAPLRGYAPNIAAFAAGSVQDAMGLPLPDIDSHPRLLYLRESVRRIASRFAGEVPVVGVLLSPVDLLPLIIGMDAWMDALLEDPGRARACLDWITPFFVDFGNALLADGATILAVTANFSNPTVVPPRVIEHITRPALEAAFAGIRGPSILHHGGQKLAAHVDAYLGLPGLAGFLVDPRDSLAQARLGIGEGPLLLGNLDGPALARKTPGSILESVQAILAERAGDPHFILATAAADIPLETPAENLRAILDAVAQPSGAR